MRTPRSRLLVCAGLTLLLAVSFEAAGAAPMSPEARARAYKQDQRERLNEGARERLERLIRHRRQIAQRRAKSKGQHLRPAKELADGEVAPIRGVRPTTLAGGQQAEALAANIQVNNRTGDGSLVGQAEVDIAVDGNNLVAAWNDGQGFNTGLSTMGYAYSTDGGASWTDGGIPPVTGGIGEWTSDPLVTVNNKTHAFYFSGLCAPSAATNGIGVVRGTFTGSVFNWGTPTVVRQAPNSSQFLDKEWVVADSSNGNLYISYSDFNPSSRIEFQRSIDDNATWSSPVAISAASDNGAVQGSQVAVGPAGEVYVCFFAIGPVDADFQKIVKSTTQGTSFGAIITALSFFDNYGTGAPGFNRGKGIEFASLAVDRSTGPHRGRVYLAWNESINFYGDNLGSTGSLSETEGNDTPATADAFTLGKHLTGMIATAPSGGNPLGDVDYFSFNGVQGQTVIFYLTESASGLNAGLRLFCSDHTTASPPSGTPLALSESEANGSALIVFTIPVSGTYYLRVLSFPFSDGTPAGIGAYQIDTGVHAAVGTDRARDHRDVFTTYSDNGVAWTTPVRVNDDPGRFDDWLPMMTVAGNGKPYVAWYDWRDSPAANCGGHSVIYLSRSEDGGNTWVSGTPVSDVSNSWQIGTSNIAPNQGDYNFITSDANFVYPCWSDNRNGDPDIFMSKIDVNFTAVDVSLVSAAAQPDRVSLSWYSADRPGLRATVYRRTTTSEWNAIGSIVADGSGLLHYDDTDVTPGAHLGYRLGVDDSGTERFIGEVWVDVPHTLQLALQGARPNPTTGDLWISLSLPGGAPATLELLDIAGRRVRMREIPAGVAGNQLVHFSGPQALPAGVYVVRLTQGDRSLTTHVSVVR